MQDYASSPSSSLGDSRATYTCRQEGIKLNGKGKEKVYFFFPRDIGEVLRAFARGRSLEINNSLMGNSNAGVILRCRLCEKAL